MEGRVWTDPEKWGQVTLFALTVSTRKQSDLSPLFLSGFYRPGINSCIRCLNSGYIVTAPPRVASSGRS